MTDVGPYASITQHNNIMNKIYHVMPREKTCHVLHRLSLSVQSVYMGWDREDFPPKKMVRDGAAKGRGLHATATKAPCSLRPKPTLDTRTRNIASLPTSRSQVERCLEPLTLTTPFYLVVVGVCLFVCLQSQLHFALVLSHLICCWLPNAYSSVLLQVLAVAGHGGRPRLVLFCSTAPRRKNEDEEEEDQVYCTDPTRRAMYEGKARLGRLELRE